MSMTTKLRFSQIKNDKIEKHANEYVEVKSRQTGAVRERMVGDLLSEAEKQDAWFQTSEPEQRTIGFLDRFMDDYIIIW